MPFVHRARRMTVVGLVLIVALLGLSGGCWSSYAEYADGEMSEVFVPEAVGADDGGRDADSEADVDAEAEADDAADVSEDADADADAGVDADAGDAEREDASADIPDEASAPCPEGWYDPTSGLCWQNPPRDGYLNWRAAVAYCENLSLGGHPAGTWHLPTISESRSLIRGCPGTVTGGACGVTDSCLGEACWSSSSCFFCSYLGGPGAGGCYWDAALGGTCLWCWSSSSYSGSSSSAWRVYFHLGSVYYTVKTYDGAVRCVRRGP